MLAEAFKKDYIHVLIAGSTRIQTELLAEALQRDTQLETTPAGPELEDIILTSGRVACDVVIISSSLAERPSNGLDLLRTLRASHPNLRLIVLLDSSRVETIVEAFKAGARGILSREESVEALCKCVHCVYEGQVWANSSQLVRVLDVFTACPSVQAINANGVELLSLREKQVVTALAEGLTNREIAERLSLSPHTVKNYLFRIFDKIGVSSRSELLSLTLTNHAAPHKNPRVEAKDCSICRAGVLRWMQKAAEEGLVVAQCALAHLYRTGQGVPRDLGLAYKWQLISEANCVNLPDEILNTRREVAALLAPEQLRSAERAANLWCSASR